MGLSCDVTWGIWPHFGELERLQLEEGKCKSIHRRPVLAQARSPQ